MRKEVLYAIIAGIILGLIVAFGVWRINSTISSKKVTDLDTPSPAPTKPPTPNEFKVVLDKPSQDDVITQSSIAVSGLTKPGVWVTLSGESGDYTVQSDSSGAFSQEVELTPGVNQIKVTAFESTGNKNATSVLVVYSSSFQEKTSPTGSPGANASGAGDINEKVKEDVANTLSRPKAYIGTVTDITDSTIQIKNMTSQIQQISISTQTSTVNSTGTVSKTVKTADIAIGDFIVAMGYVDKSVLSAQRILITDPVTEPKTTVLQAKIVSISKKTITVSTVPEKNQEILTPDTNTVIKVFKDGKPVSDKMTGLNADDTLIYINTTDAKNTTSVRSIFQIQKSQG